MRTAGLFVDRGRRVGRVSRGGRYNPPPGRAMGPEIPYRPPPALAHGQTPVKT